MNNIPMENENMESVSGIVDSIIYQNEENGYTVCEIEDTQGYPVTLTGIIPYLTEGDKITAHGKWTNHPTYGRQFKVEMYDKTLPAEQGDMLRYLASGAVKGIGPKTAQKIVEMFGTDSFNVIENHPDWLADIPGITTKKAAAISENFKAISGARHVMMFCRDFFTPQTAMKIYKRWGGAAVDRIRSNPYRLCEDFRGISFNRADQIAMSMGYSAESDERILHGARHVLSAEAGHSGHTCLPYSELCRCTLDLLFGGNEEYEGLVKSVLDDSINKLTLVPVKKSGVIYVYEPEMYKAETYVAKKLKSMNRLCPKIDSRDSVLLIEKCESQSGIKYALTQKQAMHSAMSEGVMILTGGPGTGKTTIIKGLISIFSSLDYDIALCAPTGRAAKRMSEATSHEAKTIHRLLEMDYADDDGSRFIRNDSNTLDADVVIVDEASMIDINLMESLLRAVKNGSRLILIGDSDQLPSVGAGNVLGDIIASGCFNVVRLTEIFRQSEESLIITGAHKINNGEMPTLTRKDGDFFFLPRETEDGIWRTVVDLVQNRLPRSYGADVVSKIQIITPSRKGASGTENLNVNLQAALNPPSRGKNERKSRDIVFREGDRVMQTKNNYSIEWETDDGRQGLGVFNGDIGTVTEIDNENGMMTVKFDERVATLDFSMLDEIDHSYAVTVHKSQGSEYPIVIIPLYSCAPMLLSRNLLYTAVTRASKMVILVGKQEILSTMIENDRHTERCTMLEGFLKSDQI
ncbi:MAG: ATP-dependent RecD-like DNA helicase [Clostridia bacterium]|nr:ATP-dependent RecD-like DNA helicase [Clostridia bacterium]